MAVNDLVELATNAIAQQTTLRDLARQELATAQQAERQTRDAIAAEVPEIQRLELAGTNPAELRRRRNLIVDLRRAELAAGADARAAGERAERAAASVAEWEARRVRGLADQQEDRVTWPAALAALLTVPADATARLTDLGTRVGQVNVPAKLLAAVRARSQAAIAWRAVADQRVAAAEDALDRLDEKNGGIEAKAAMERRAWERTRAEVAAFLLTAPSTMAAAVALLAEPLPAVSAAERAALDDAARLAARRTAADAETALRTAEIDEADALAAREVAELRALRDPAYDPQPAITAHTQAAAFRQNKATTFDTTKRERVLDWQAEAQPSVWSYVARVEELRAALALLKATHPDRMDNDLVDADKAYAQAVEEVQDKVAPWRTTRWRLRSVQLQKKATLEAPASIGA